MEGTQTAVNLGRILGFHPYFNDYNPTWIGYVYMFLTMIASGFSIASYNEHDYKNIRMATAMAFELCQGVICYVTLVGCCFGTMLNRKSMLKAKKHIQRFDKSLPNFYPPDNFRFMSFCVFVSFCFELWVYKFTATKIVYAFSFYHNLFGVYLIQMEFAICLNLIKERFRILSAAKMKPSKSIPLYTALKISCAYLNKHFSTTLLFSSAFIFSLIAFQLYFFAFSLISFSGTTMQNINQKLNLAALNLLHFLLHGYVLLKMTKACEGVTEEGEKFNQMLYARSLTEDKALQKGDPMLKIHLTVYEPLQFTACNFFTVDYKLANMIIGASFTYLVILFQMSNIVKNQPN